MSAKCFVPSCKNKVGIAFPDDEDIKQKWLEILGIPHMKPKPSSFVCLDHFQDDGDADDLSNIENGKIGTELKPKSNRISIEGKTDGDKPDEKHIKQPVTSGNLEICRLCMEHKDETKNIFIEEIEESTPIVFAILACIHPIEISYEDNLPKTICIDCLNILEVCFKFRSVCLKNDKIQKQSSRGKIQPVTSSAKKQKRTEDIETDTPEPTKKAKTSEAKDNYDELEAINEFLVKKDVKQSAVKAEKDDPSSRNDSTNIMEEELRKVLEGTLSEEQASADNIIIQIQNDDESAEDSDEQLDDSEMQKSPRQKRGRASSHEVYSEKTVNVKSGKTIQSTLGIYEGTNITSFYDMQFCEVDNYLFEYRLCKQNVRYMRCLMPYCAARGMQTHLGSFVFGNDVTITTPHNHKCPTEAEKKKHIFFYIMKRKMHSDKSLKFKNIYDEICQKDSEIKQLIPLRNVINEICRHQFNHKLVPITSFDVLYNYIEDDSFQKYQFTLEGTQFYQERFSTEDNAKAIVFANLDIIEEMSDSDLMYIDASFRIETNEPFSYQLVTVLVWIDESYYPIMYALVNYKTQEIYKKIFEFLHDTLAPHLRPDEIVTEYESNLYYALGEIYVDSSIGGSVFYYTQNIYKKICNTDLAKSLETNTYFRNIYHMLLMLPLLPVNTIADGFKNIQAQAQQMGIYGLIKHVFAHIENEWLKKVTPDLFCVHRLENRINENVIAPFKKLRDYIMLSKGKSQKSSPDVLIVIEKIIELEQFLHVTYTSGNKKCFSRDLSSTHKKNVLKAWQFIESHPKININNFFSRVLGYIKCMENQLWIWGFYRYKGEVTDELINAANFSIICDVDETEGAVDGGESTDDVGESEEMQQNENGEDGEEEMDGEQVIMDAVMDESGGFVLKARKGRKPKSNST
ncbi:unnamed protein product [Phyllotreta striolata]|uniref:ZAD domain-containing protein n=1 Tax=Phyllotreta striolata TaxID=444603 RepID=A0A9N9XS60_PHYSR|nr:unnamed protein product [Phyllotreta striolata]